MNGSRRPKVAAEGIPYLFALAVLAVAVFVFGGWIPALLPLALFACALVVFHDPGHATPTAPLGVVSPVDGTVVAVERIENGVPRGETHRIVIRINNFGTYTARSPVEGKIMDLRGEDLPGAFRVRDGGLWLHTDEGADVVLRFTGNRFGIAPRSLVRYGERVGQGHVCAYLRLAAFAEVQLPATGRVLVAEGQRVAAGMDVLAKLPSSSPEDQVVA